MRAESDTLAGGRGRESQLQGPSDLLDEIRSAGKPPGRVDKMAAAVLQLCYALRLLGKTCDEGPLRTAVLEAAARAEARARDSVYSPQQAALRRQRRRQSDHLGTVAEETRDGAQDDEEANSPERVTGFDGSQE